MARPLGHRLCEPYQNSDKSRFLRLSATSLPYREGLGIGGCLFVTFSAPEKAKILPSYEEGVGVLGQAKRAELERMEDGTGFALRWGLGESPAEGGMKKSLAEGGAFVVSRGRRFIG